MLSALQKSIRGSDPDAAVFYLAKILEGGDLIGACRRLQVIAAEDIGLAYPQAIPIVRACVEMAFDLGMPEARLPLADAAILLATAPKSNSGHDAMAAAMACLESGKGQNVPSHMRPSNRFDGYKYPHDYPNHYVKQQYLPDDIKNEAFYTYGDNKTEQAAKAYWDNIKK
jgi:putative ATPase